MEIHKGEYSFSLLFPSRKQPNVTKTARTQLRTLLGLSRPLKIDFIPKAKEVFLYLQPQSITYRRSKAASVCISLEHETNTVTKLTDFYTEDNKIYMDTFSDEKPTFSLTIKQDDLEDIEKFTDSPLKLTLYEDVSSDNDEVHFAHSKKDPTKKKAVAYGYVDLMQFFLNKRAHSTVGTFLYPLDVSFASDSCKITWEIYSLMPIIKEVKFSNVIFIGFASLFNIDDNLLENCDDLVATLSFQPKYSNKGTKYEKIPICKYTAFTKKIIYQQSTFYKWENLKDPQLKNYDSLGICSDIELPKIKLFDKLLCTENVDFNFSDINMKDDYALVCNSMHRFILTDKMHIALEKHLVCDEHEIIVEIFKESEPAKMFLQGFIDLSVFMYPGVTNCSFGVELKPPMTSLNLSTSLKSWEGYESFYNKTYHNEILKKTSFAIVTFCMKLPMTNSAEDLNEAYNVNEMQQNIFKDCWRTKVVKRGPPLSKDRTCKEHYKEFDENILRLIHYLDKNNELSTSENKSFFCSQITNISSRILPLISCDFNERYPTETNIEFVNLMTVVFRELMERCYGLVHEAIENPLLEDAITDNNLQTLLIREMSFAKLLYHIGNTEMSQYIFDMLAKKYGRYPLYRFYIFLNDIEMENFKSARRYLMIPSQGKYNDGLFVTELCEIYLDYMEDVNSTDGEDNVAENLLKALTHYCEEVQRKFPIGWVILYCVYKKHNYNPGMSYARWKYENLVDAFFIEIKYIPKSRWEIFNNFTPKLITKKGIFFWKGCQFLLQFGLYYFAWLLFEDIANELEEIERYIIDTSFKLAVKLVGSNFITQNFLLGERMADELKAFVCLVNGNIEYYRDPYKAMGHYGFILDISNASKDSRFQLGVLRYAYRMLKEKELEEALEAFEFAGRSENDLIIANVGKAKALYFLGRLKEAKLFFAETTRFSMYLPNVWAYLAVINLRLGQNYEALECWKYANLNTDVIIHDEILNELAELNIKDISLYVDSPEKRIK